MDGGGRGGATSPLCGAGPPDAGDGATVCVVRSQRGGCAASREDAPCPEPGPAVLWEPLLPAQLSRRPDAPGAQQGPAGAATLRTGCAARFAAAAEGAGTAAADAAPLRRL